MEPEKQNINVNVEKGVKELVIRHGSAEIIPKREQRHFLGTIDAPSDFFEIKKNLFKKGNDKSCPYPDTTVMVNLEIKHIVLIADEKDPLSPVVIGKLEEHSQLKQFNINKDEYWTLQNLRALIRRTRYWFSDKEQHSDVLTSLEKFRATTTSDVVNEDDRKGNVHKMLDKKTDLEKPIDFLLKIPIYKNEEPKTFIVEIFPQITDDQIRFFLDSAGLFELEEAEKQKILARATKIFDDEKVAIVYE